MIIAALIGVIFGYAITAYIRERRYAALSNALRSEIANTTPPTTTELQSPIPR